MVLYLPRDAIQYMPGPELLFKTVHIVQMRLARFVSNSRASCLPLLLLLRGIMYQKTSLSR